MKTEKIGTNTPRAFVHRRSIFRTVQPTAPGD
jgi:hypothetical protein